MAKNDKFPRLFNLVMLLLDTSKPISLEEIARRIGGFPDSPSARHQAFERAKKELRELGIPISTHQIPGEEQYGYRIDRSEMIIPDLRFSNDEAAALAAASALVSFGGGERDSALQKLGCIVAGRDATVAIIPSQPALFLLFEAMGAGKVVTFDYRSRKRTLDIYGISFRWGNWYLLGNERESGMVKTFLISRIESDVEVTDVDSLEKPDDFVVAVSLPKNRWEVGGSDQIEARILVHADVAPIVAHELGGQSVVEWRDDGSAIISTHIMESGPFIDWLLSYSDRVRLIEPDSLVRELREYLQSMVSEPRSDDLEVLLGLVESGTADSASQVRDALLERESEPSSFHATDRSNPKISELRTASAMYSALVRILPWLARKKATTVEEISETFGIAGPEVVRLLEIAACCGLPPYTPDTLLEIVVDDDGQIFSFLDMEIITSPRRLTTLEAMVLATTAMVALKVPEIDRQGFLSSALGKLQKSLSKFKIALNEVDVGIEEPYFLADVRAAVNQYTTIEITYYSTSSERITKRKIDPYQLFMESGRWYVRAFCHLTGEIRHFSLGRVISSEFTGLSFEVPKGELERIATGEVPRAFGGRGDWIVVAVPSGSGWLVERLVDAPQLLGRDVGWEIFGFQSSSIAWLTKILLRLGPHASVVEPKELRLLGSSAARSLFELYQ